MRGLPDWGVVSNIVVTAACVNGGTAMPFERSDDGTQTSSVTYDGVTTPIVIAYTPGETTHAMAVVAHRAVLAAKPPPKAQG